MNSSEQNPKLPTWLFIIADFALIGAAAFIAWNSRHPLSNTAMLWIVACVGAGAIVGLVPLIARYEQQKNEALDDRQRALEALARTVSSSAEQISIATGGLHEIAELSQKNLKHAEQLPHKLQDKIAEFQAQLSVAEDAEREELERELLSLRTSESERLESVSQRIVKSAADWTKLEAATQQHLAAANEALAKLSLGTASAIGKAQAAAEPALSQARIEAARSLGEASGQGTKAIDAAKTAALTDLEAKLVAATAAVVERITTEIGAKLTVATQALDAKIAQLESAARQIPVAAPTPVPAAPAAEASPSASATPTDVTDTPPPTVQSSNENGTTAKPESAPPPPKRHRKPRREEPAAEPGASESHPASAEEVPPAVEVTPTPVAEEEKAENTPLTAPAEPVAPAATATEPPPIPVETIPEITPIAPHTAEPFAEHITDGAPAPDAPAHEPVAAEPVPAEAAAPTEPATPKPARKRSPVAKPEPAPEAEPALALDLDDAATPAASVAERVMTSDGATRLLVTAYIGIGNRLFIRGEGPGLSWEKGVPLQFVSIGKWRWETNDASAPVKFKLYKNDDLECAALGTQTLDPAHQQEVTAAF